VNECAEAIPVKAIHKVAATTECLIRPKTVSVIVKGR
jgi:hypothetical protein